MSIEATASFSHQETSLLTSAENKQFSAILPTVGGDRTCHVRYVIALDQTG